MEKIFLIAILLGITYTDIRIRRIPNWLLVVAIGIRCAATLWEQGLQPMCWLQMIGGGLALALPLFLLTVWLDKRGSSQAIGGGDIKLVFVTGLYLGWEKNLFMFFLAGILALIYAGIRREREIPLGPAIAVATIGIMLFELI